MRYLPYLLALWLAGCADLSPVTRWRHADALAHAAGWHKQVLETGTFPLTAYVPEPASQADTLTIYIEGDGLAWLSRTRPSPDPTPMDPLALRLALRHPSGTAAYLARPCQFNEPDIAPACHPRYWSTHRFSPEVITASDEAVSQLKLRYHAKSLILVGYSGGGAVATLLAAKRQDVAMLITVAGNLEPDAWTRLHHITPLSGSLNPSHAWDALQHIPQVHFIGGADSNIPDSVFEAYARHFPAGHRPDRTAMENFDHRCCWVEQWPNLFAQASASWKMAPSD